ncbi:endoglucanase [Luteipulveratus mongoliensis]|uniref:Glucanase n=1 Tax=Luteipulveratus mongoliensis TaxID=571913 RepID=A0A0K1JRR8_9MICO|nr:endoglucanase [Luteipulveratus mongoliensis]
MAPAHADGPANPLQATDGFYADPDSNSAQWVKDNPDAERAPTIKKEIADKPGALWLGDWTADPKAAVEAYTKAAQAENKMPVLVTYNIPGRDCKGESDGGADSPEEYRTWISQFAEGLGDRPAVVILEPDALAQYDCLPDQGPTRLELLHFASDQMAGHPNTWAYMDAGHSSWIDSGEMANRLKQVGVEGIRGFALNTSNYQTTEDSVAYGKAVNDAIGGTSHYVVDTSRNGTGPKGDEWCNPEGRKIGVPAQTSDDADMLLWVKNVGDSDGDCGLGEGTKAGDFTPELAMHLITGE